MAGALRRGLTQRPCYHHAGSDMSNSTLFRWGIVLVWVVMTGLACGSPPIQTENPTSRPPDILLFLADDHGRWAAGPYGNDEVATPALDREGWRRASRPDVSIRGSFP